MIHHTVQRRNNQVSSIKFFIVAFMLLTLGPHLSYASTIEAIVPNLVVEGELISIQGHGFGTEPLNHAVLIYRDGAMISADVLSASPNELIGQISGVDEPMTGDVYVHQGPRTLYPDRTLAVEDRTYLVSNSSWFEANNAGETGSLESSGAELSTSNPGSGVNSLQGPGNSLHLRVGSGGPPTISGADAIIFTCDDMGGTPPDENDRTLGILRKNSSQVVFQARISLRPTNAAAAEQWQMFLLKDLALALNQEFGARGLSAFAPDQFMIQIDTSTSTSRQTCGQLRLTPSSNNTPAASFNR